MTSSLRRLLLVMGLSSLVVTGASAQDIVWVRQFGTGFTDIVVSTAAALDGTTYVAGFTNGVLPGQTGQGATDAFVRKYDPNGNELWTRQFGTGAPDSAYSVDIDVTGNIVVAGQTDGTFSGQVSAGGTDAFVRCYSANGSIQWTRQFGTAGYEGGYAVDTDGGSNIVVAGRTHGAFPSQVYAGAGDVFVRRYNVNGTELWTRQFGGAAPDTAFAVSVSPSGEAVVAGSTGAALPGQTHQGMADAFLRRYTSGGIELWTRQFGTSVDDDVFAVTGSGPIYAGGRTFGDLPGHVTAGAFDAFVGAFEADGTPRWTRQFGSPENDRVGALGTDRSGALFAGGETDGAFPGEVSTGLTDAFVRRYEPDGSAGWTHQFGTELRDGVQGLGSDGERNVIAGGFTEGELPGATSAGGMDAFLLSMSQPSCVDTANPDGDEEGPLSGPVHDLEPSVPDSGLRGTVHEVNCTVLDRLGL